MECNSDEPQRPQPPRAGRLLRAFLNARRLTLLVVVALLLIAVVWLGAGIVELFQLLGSAVDYLLATVDAAADRAVLRDALLAGALDATINLLLAAFFCVLGYGLYALLIERGGPSGGSRLADTAGRLLATRNIPQLLRRLAQLILLMLAVQLFGYGLAVPLDAQGPQWIDQLLRLAGVMLLIVAALYVAVYGLRPWRITEPGRWQARRQFWVRLPVYTALGILVLWVNPYGVSDVTDKASQDALYRVIAPSYDLDGNRRPDDPAKIPAGRDDIVVVLLDENGIAQLHERRVIAASEWPILYRDHGKILGHILSYRPRALFVDVHFKRRRERDDSFDSMIRRLERAKPPGWDGLLFAGGFPTERATRIRDELDTIARLPVTGWEGYRGAYPLHANGRHTAAYALYRIARCEGDRRDNPDCIDDQLLDDKSALSVRWGSAAAAPVLPSLVSEVCQPAPAHWLGVLGEMAGRAANGLFGADVHTERQRCPYHRTLFAHELIYVDRHGTAEQKDALDRALRDKIVLFGVALSGLQDSVVSPVHGRLPGVMLHAMALDNLLVYGKDYVRAADDALAWLNAAVWLLLVLVLCVVLYLMEVREAASRAPCARRRRHSRLRIWGFGVVAVVAVSLASFFLLGYEPVNAIGFMALGAVVGQLVHSDLSGKVLRVYDCYQRCPESTADDIPPRGRARCKGGEDDAQKDGD